MFRMKRAHFFKVNKNYWFQEITRQFKTNVLLLLLFYNLEAKPGGTQKEVFLSRHALNTSVN